MIGTKVSHYHDFYNYMDFEKIKHFRINEKAIKLGIEYRRKMMTQKEYKKKILELLHECNDKIDEAYKKAKEEGTLESGIDGNMHIERKIEREYHQKLLKLKEEYESPKKIDISK